MKPDCSPRRDSCCSLAVESGCPQAGLVSRPHRHPAGVKRLLIWLLGCLLLPLLIVLATLERAPLVSRSESISPASIAEAKRLLANNDPRRLQRGDQRTASIPAPLIDEAINHLVSRSLHGRGTFALAEETAEIRISVPVPGLAGYRYWNLRAQLQEAEGEPRIVAASLANLPVPSRLAEFCLNSAIGLAGFSDEWRAARQLIRKLAFEPARGVVEVSYVWEPGVLVRARALAFPPEDIASMAAAQKALAAQLDHYSARARVPLGQVLSGLLTVPASGEATLRQRRAALLVLASYLAEKNLAVLIPEARHWPRPRRLKLILLGRYDSAQHFAVSAALAAWAGEPAANAIGLYKEVEDSRGGSGFSFADLAADRAGTRFGELVAEGSSRLDVALRGSLGDSDLAPSLDGLPEALSEAEFQRRYGGRDNPAYRQLLSEIERRLAALPLYR